MPKKDQPESHGDDSELLQRVVSNSGALGRASVILQELPGALAEENLKTRDSELLALVGRLRTLVMAIEGKSVYYEPMIEKPLSEHEYIIPPELLKDGSHQRVLDFFGDPKKKTISLPHSGMLLYGVSGTGKTEYVRHLMHLLRENPSVVFVNGNISRILNAPAPGDAIAGLYRGLQQKAEHDDVKYVLLFDEFEGLVRQLLKKLKSVRTTTSDMATGPRRTHSREEKSQTDEAEVDRTGEEIFAALKSVLKGTGGIDRVFTIATSNSSDFEASLVSRLEAVEIKPISIPVKEFSVICKLMLCQEYPEIIGRILELMQAMNYRERGQINHALSSVAEEFANLASHMSAEVSKITTTGPKKSGRKILINGKLLREDQQEAINILWLKELFGFLNISIPDLREWLANQTKVVLGYGMGDGKIPETINLTHQQIARDTYLRNIGRYSDVNSAKRELALLLYPQLGKSGILKTE